YLTLTITKNFATLDLTALDTLQDSVNTATWNGFTAGRCHMDNITFDYKQENGVTFWEHTYTIQIRKVGDDWTRNILDCGFSYLDGSGSGPRNLVAFETSTGD